MQIHELNNFTGTLGSGAYLAVDDGTDTGKLSTQQLLAATEARIDNIIAGPAPSAEEIVDARLGADGVTYPSLGDAIRDQFTDVKSDIGYIWQASDNIFNPDDFIWGKSINNSGVETDSADFGITTNYYELPYVGDNYFYINSNNVASEWSDFKGVYYVIRYDEDKTFLARASMAAQSYSGISTTNTKYVRFMIGKNTEDLMLVVKPTFDSSYNPAYAPYGGEFSNNAESYIKEFSEEAFDTVTDNGFDIPLKHILKTGGMTSIFRTAGVVGDSLASGCMEYKDEHDASQGYDRYEFSWLQQMKHICGFEIAYNFSAGGLTSKKFWTSTNSHITDLREDGANHKCQLYFIALGVNDIADTTLDVGTSADISNNASTTFYGYYSRIIKLIQSIQPKARIFLVGLPNHSNMTVWGSRFTNFKNAIADMVNYFDNCYYLDLFTYDVPYDATFQQTYFNGFHENALGYLRSAWVISSYVDWYIRHNYEEFREVGFIGTDLHYYSE